MKRLSVVLEEIQPEFVNDCIQIEPPTVICPVWNAKRGLMTRMNGGVAGYYGPNRTSKMIIGSLFHYLIRCSKS